MHNLIGGEIEIMKNLYFDDFEDLACDIADTYDSLKCEGFEDVAIVAKYEEARQIIKELICIGYDISDIELHEVDWDNYDAEYIISLYDNSIWCEPMLRENGYLTDDSPVMYILDNCSSKVIPYCKGKTVYEVSVGEEECDCDECQCACTDKDTDDSESTHISRDKHGNPLGFSKTWSTVRDGVHCYSSYSHYSSDVNMLRSIASDFGVRL